MTTIDTPQELTAEDKFFRLLTHYPFLAQFWTRATMTKKHHPSKSAKYDDEALSKAALSPQQRLIATALLSIWDRDSDNLIDFTELAALDMRWKKPLLTYAMNPF